MVGANQSMHFSIPKPVYIDGVQRAGFDAEIARLLRPNEWGAPDYVAALCNEAGEIYRIVTVEGLGDYVHLVEGLKRLGLVDFLEMRMARVGNYDAVFALEGTKVNIVTSRTEN